MNTTREIQCDGLVGPTHNYAGIAWGNLASMKHGQQTANPRLAALQGLAKMELVSRLGITQLVLPPHERPDLGLLRRLGFGGSDAQVIRRAIRHTPPLVSAAWSAAAMWAANAATVSPSADTADGRIHFTPANLTGQLHRSIEAAMTARILRTIFNAPQFFVHHDPLPPALALRDEGAANQLRLAPPDGRRGLEIFVYGIDDLAPADTSERPANRYPARQTAAASAAVARNHELHARAVAFIRQNPVAIDAGVFHNDVISLAQDNVLICHEHAFAAGAVDDIRRRYRSLFRAEPVIQIVPGRGFSLADAVDTYLFNSQLLKLPDGRRLWLAPEECQHHRRAMDVLQSLRDQGTFSALKFINVRQSMRNGGGPACLRLRVLVTPAELAAVHRGVILTPTLARILRQWINRHYRDRLPPRDLADPKLITESRTALDELTRLLGLPALYDFQRQPGRAAVP